MTATEKADRIHEILDTYPEGRIFAADFITRTTGKPRTMVARTGVRKGTTGAGFTYDPASKGLLPVFDMQKRAYRSIPLENVTGIRAGGHTFNLN